MRRLPSGRAENRLHVLGLTAPTEVVVRADDGPTPFTYRYVLAASDSGTLLSLAAETELDGPLRVLGPLAARMIKRGVDANLAALKRMLER